MGFLLRLRDVLLLKKPPGATNTEAVQAPSSATNTAEQCSFTTNHNRGILRLL